MDNCSTMRGIRGGVEALIRKKNPQLLNVSGDTVHMINNVAKTMMNCIDSSIQALCSDLYYDIEESPKVRQVYHDLQAFMNVKTAKHLIRPIPSRFLQMLDVATRAIETMDFLTIYYFGFLTEDEKSNYRALISHIFKEHHVSDEAQAAVILLQLSQDKQQKSATSKDRKDRILSSLFQNRKETTIKLNLLRGLLSVFQEYVKYFQSEKPTMHILHERMMQTVSEFLGMFIKPQHIPDKISKLVKIDVTDHNIQKADKDLSVGKYAHAEMTKARMDKSCHHWLTPLYRGLRSGYIAAAKKILQLPIENKTLRLLSVLDPELVGHDQTAICLKKLTGKLPHLFTDQEVGQLAMEADRYSVDKQVKEFSQIYRDLDTKDQRIDSDFWIKVFELKHFTEQRYPMLKRLIAALLSIFSGPLVESSFNIMDDIVEKDRTKLTVFNYEAIAIIKTVLRKKGIKSTKMTVPPKMKRACINAYSTYKQDLERRKAEVEKKKQERLDSSVQMLKLERAKQISKLVRLKQRILSKNANSRKRKAEDSSKSSKAKWKRIRLL